MQTKLSQSQAAKGVLPPENNPFKQGQKQLCLIYFKFNGKI